MENQNKNQIRYQSNKAWVGLFIIAVGVLLLLNNFGLNLPNWLFTWSTFVLALGIIIGYKHNFKGSGWFVMVLIGVYFTISQVLGSEYDMSYIGFPIMLVIIGLFIIFKPKRDIDKWGERESKWKKRFHHPAESQNFDPEEKITNRNDYIDSVNVFGGSRQTVYSKNFKGGKITAIFGGCDVNLSHADFSGEIAVDITAICGGVKIILPPGWQIKHKLTTIFGGLR